MLLNAEEAARYLGTTPQHIRTLYKTGQLAYVRVGRFPRYRLEDLDAFVAARQVQSTDDEG